LYKAVAERLPLIGIQYYIWLFSDMAFNDLPEAV